MRKALLLAGFVDPGRAPTRPGVVTAEKPEWAAGAAAPLKKKGGGAVAGGGAAAWKLAADDEDGDAHGGGALIDDDALLTEADRAKPVGEFCLWMGGAAPLLCFLFLRFRGLGLTHSPSLPKKNNQITACAPGTAAAPKKACKDCTCGLADAQAGGVEKKAVLTKEMLDNPKSQCGSCGLGDAYRCAGCPYRGLPSFKDGEKITLPADFVLGE